MSSTYPSLTEEGRNRIITSLSHYQSDKERYKELLKDILGAELNFGKSHTILFPGTLRGVELVTGGFAEQFILKVCYKHMKGESHDCPLLQEGWVWKEAVRRGDEHLFAPIVEVNKEMGWSIMSYGSYLDKIERAVPVPQSPEQVSLNSLSDGLRSDLRKRGWIPYDTEVRAINEEPIVIDYEKMYPEDMFDGLYVNSFRNFYQHQLYSSEVIEANRRNTISEESAQRRREHMERNRRSRRRD